MVRGAIAFARRGFHFAWSGAGISLLHHAWLCDADIVMAVMQRVSGEVDHRIPGHQTHIGGFNDRSPLED